MRLLVQGHKKRESYFQLIARLTLVNLAVCFFSKNRLFSRTHVVSLVVEEYLLFFVFFSDRCPITLEKTV